MRKIAGIASICLISIFCQFISSTKADAAEKWPDKPLTFVVSFGAGGSLDALTRRLAKCMEEELGISIVVVNRPGAGGLVGTTYFMELPDDGTNLLFGSQIFLSSSILLQNASYSLDDISLISFLQIDRDVLSVAQDSPYKTFDDVLSAIKENPGKIRISTTSGSSLQIMLDNLKDQLGLDFRSVYFDSAAERQAALLGGHLDVSGGGMLSSIRNGEKILLVMGYERHQLLPDVPTLNEVLPKPVNFDGPSVFVGVHKTMREKHPERYQWLVDAIYKTVTSERYQKTIKEAGTDKVAVWFGPEKSDALNREFHQTVDEFKDSLQGK